MIINLLKKVKESFCDFETFPSSIALVKVSLKELQNRFDESGENDLGNLYLTPQETERFRQFRYQKRKVEWLGGRIAAKCAYLQLENGSDDIFRQREEWQRVDICADPHGKPYVSIGQKKGFPLEISISHSGEIAIGLAASEQCGVDIQKISQQLERVQSHFVRPQEKHYLSQIAGQHGPQTALSLLWSAKEAVKKAVPRESAPGFMDIQLLSFQQKGRGYLFEVAVQKKGRQAESLSVWTCEAKGFSLAITLAGRHL